MNEIYKRRWSEQATLDDIYFCYRLLLGREPGEEGLKFWSERLATEQFTYSKLAAYFRQSREYVTGKRARGIKLVELDEFDLYVQEYDWDIGENIIRSKQYEPHVTAFLKQHLGAGMTFIDVGANIGYFTLMAARLVGRSGRVIAVECNPKNCELIYLSLHRNNCDDVLVYPFALSNTQKLMSFTSGFSNGIVNELAEDEEEAVIVPAVTLDSLVQNEPRIDIIKMDIEGSEAKAWQGMQQVIAKHHPVILMEFFPALLENNSGVKGDEFLHSIFARGYTAAVLQPERDELLQASSPAEVMEAWNKQCEAIGDEAKAYLDLVFIRVSDLHRFPSLFAKLNAVPLRTERKIYSINGIQLSIVDYITSVATEAIASELSNNTYPIDEIGFEPGDKILDLGGHVGMVSIYLAKKYPFVKIYAYEPCPENYEHFLLNLEANQVRNVQVFNKAVTQDGRLLNMIANFRINSGGATANLRDMKLAGHTCLQAESTTLDEIFSDNNIEHCKLLKIDIEGSEHEVLLNSNCLNRVEYLIGEFHINDNLEQKGYSVERLHEHLKRFIPEHKITFTSCRMAE